jgi:hypothetical protein
MQYTVCSRAAESQTQRTAFTGRKDGSDTVDNLPSLCESTLISIDIVHIVVGLLLVGDLPSADQACLLLGLLTVVGNFMRSVALASSNR